jgi:hypothetical protein
MARDGQPPARAGAPADAGSRNLKNLKNLLLFKA